MKKVAVMGLVDWNNYGEQFLAKDVAYLIGEQYEKKFVNFEPSKHLWGHIVYWMMIVLTRVVPGKQKPYFLTFLGVKFMTTKYFQKELQDCDAIIFACGSYKFRTQKLWAYYSSAVEVAEQMGMPVMFDAMNIQDYDDKDWRCRCMKDHTNYSCVKMFTTRDGDYGVKKLRNSYLNNPDIKVLSVGDPAFWIPECYGIEKSNNQGKIGINLIRGKIFVDYGYTFSESQLVDLYCELIHKLDEKGIEWELFTNGLEVDYRLGCAVLQRCNRKDVTIKVPKKDRELVEMIAGYRGVIGARLHACICAYSLDVPVVGFIWDEKLVRFAEIAGLQDFFLTEAELNADNVLGKLEKAFHTSYDVVKRDCWKNKTRDSINEFLTEW
jgi:hypothetical protein